jgi:hypothetical protein
VLTGATSPWNTLALWSVPKLAVTGFLGVADGLTDKTLAGIEEVGGAHPFRPDRRVAHRNILLRSTMFVLGWPMD